MSRTAARSSALARPIPQTWPRFRDWFHGHYRQDEHVSLLGPTGVGKTTLAVEILEARECVIAIATKPEDPVVEKFGDYGYRVQDRLDVPSVELDDGRKVPHPHFRRVVLWPRDERDSGGNWRSTSGMIDYQRDVIYDALEYVRRARRWTVFSDDVMFLAEDLKLGPQLKWMWRQGRSAGISLVVAAQRPAWVPRDAYSAPSHLFFWHTNDKNDLERLSDIGAGIDRRDLEAEITSLKRYEFLYIAPRHFPPILIRSKVTL